MSLPNHVHEQVKKIIKAFSFVKILFTSCFLVPGALAQEPTYLQALIETAKSQNLAQERAWRKLLLIPDRFYQSDRSIIDDPAFFFAKDGKNNAASELEATLAAFFQAPPASPPKDYNHPQCRFAARFWWLGNKLEFDGNKMQFQDCSDTKKFLDFLEYQSVSLVFSNYYVDNPSSMFGHTFLRLHRRKDQKQNDLSMLDDIINFSAFVHDSHSILYPFKGLAGYYPGRFSLLPYYSKIQEYNNFESRDLWEYELNLESEHIRMLERVLWEMGSIYLDYYYLDDNCSYIMLSLLEAANPELRLTGQFNVYATPADTLRAAVNSPHILRNIRYRPSSLSRFLIRYKSLDENEQDHLNVLIKNEPATWVHHAENCNLSCQAKVIDTALEYIDFKKQDSDKRKQLLIARSKIPVKPELLADTPMSSRPDLGHDGGYLGLSYGALKLQSQMDSKQMNHKLSENNTHFAQFRWRPALHDLNSNDEGYSRNLQIGFLDTKIRWRGGADPSGYLKDLSLLQIMSLPDRVPYHNSFAWRFDLGYERGFYLKEHAEHSGRQYLQLGIGSSAFFLNQKLSAFALINGDLGYNQRDLKWHLGPMIMTGLMIEPADFVTMQLSSKLARYFNSKTAVNSVSWDFHSTFHLTRKWDARLSVNREQKTFLSNFEMVYYF